MPDEKLMPERPVIRINWTEHGDPRIAEGKEMSLLEADELLKELDEAALGDARYYKTSFTIEYPYEGELHTYEGRYDIGDGDGSIIDHISMTADDFVDIYSNHQNPVVGPKLENKEKTVEEWEYVGNTLVPYFRMHLGLESLERSTFLMRSRLYYAVDNPDVVMFRKDSGEPFSSEELNINRDYYDSIMMYIHMARQELNEGRNMPQQLPELPKPFITQSNEVSTSIVNLQLAKQIGDFYWDNDRDNYENMLDENMMDRYDHIIRIQSDLDRGNHYRYIEELENVTYASNERDELLTSLRHEQMDYLDKQERLLSSINHIEYDDVGRLHFLIKALDGHELDGTYVITNSSNEDVKRLDSIYQGNLYQEITTYWDKIEQRLTEYVDTEVDIEGIKCHIVDRWVDKNGVSYAVGYDIEDNEWYYGQAEFDGKTIDFTFDDHRPSRELFEQVYNEYDDNINIQAVMFQNEDADKVISEITRLREQMLIDYPECGISMDHLSEEIIHAAFASNDKEMLDNIYNTLEEIEHYLFENIGLTTDNDITDMVVFSQADLDSFRKKYLGNELVNGRIEIDEKNETEVQRGEEEVSDQVDTNSPAPSDKQLNYANKIAQALNIDLPKARTKTAYQKFISENQERFSLISSNHVHFTDEQIERANNVDIVAYAQSAGLELKREGRDYKATNYHGGLTITPQKNNWHLFAEDKGGGVVQLCMLLENKSWQEAIATLINEEMQPAQYVPPVQEEETKEFILPERNNTTKHVYAYLIKTRGIEPDIVKEMLDKGYIYENTYGACVFVGKDPEGVPRHASVRSTNTEGRVYKRDVPGSQKRYSFSITGNTDTLYVFEAPIDLLSYMSYQRLAGMDTNSSYVSLGGVSDRALERFLSDNPHIKKIVVCTDRDKAGDKGYERIRDKYKHSFEITRHSPLGKDFNADLVAYRNIDNQQIQEYAEFVNNHRALISQKNTARIPLVINAFGGPGAGKSVSCMDICQQLKKLGYNAEYVQEYAKELVYDGNMELLDGSAVHQFDMLKEQLARMDRLYGNVDFIVTDSPLLLNGVYNKELTPEYEQLIADLQSHFENFTYFVERDETHFQQEGRIHDLEQSKKIDAEIKQLLNDKGIYFGTYDHETINKIVANSIITFNRINNIQEPATERQISYAREIAAKLSVELPEDNSKAAYRAFISDYQEAFRKGSQVFSDEVLSEKSFAEQVDEVLEGRMQFYSAVKVCDTPEILIEAGCEQLPMLMTQKHLKDAMEEKDENNIHKHGLTKNQILNMPQLLNEPVVIYDSLSRDDCVVVVTSDFDSDKLPILAAVRPNGSGRYELETINSNFIMSYHGRNNFYNQLISAVENNKLLYVNKIKIQEMFERWGLQLPELTKSLVFDTIIHPSNNIVKKNQQNIEENLSSNDMADSASEAMAVQVSYEQYLNDMRTAGKDVRKLLREAPAEYLTYELYMVAIESWGALIKEVPADMLTEEMCIAAVKQYGMNLKSIPEDMRTEAVCVEAYISGGGKPLRHTPKEIRETVKEKASHLLEQANTTFSDVKRQADADSLKEQGEEWLNVISQKLAEYEQDPAAMAELVEWAGRFYNYSLHNIQLMRTQNPGMTYVASAAAFEKMGYHIKPGEQAMIARVPLFGHYVIDEHGERIYSLNYTKEIKKAVKDGMMKEYQVVRGFQFVPAFYDISQTDCPPSDYPLVYNMGIPSELHGRTFDAMKEFAESLGFKIMVTDLKSISLRGLCEPDKKIIRINDRLQQTMALSTLCHEIAHGILHTSKDASKMSTAQKECEADVMDIMLESSLGLPISDARREHLKKSFDAYKTEQASKDRPYEVTLQKLIDRVQTKLFRPHIESINNYLAKYMPKDMEVMANRLISNYALLDAVYEYGNNRIISEYPDIFDEEMQGDYEKLYAKYVEEAKLNNSFMPKLGVLRQMESGAYELYNVYLSSEEKVQSLMRKDTFDIAAKSFSVMPGMIVAYKRDVLIESEFYMVTPGGLEKLSDISTERLENKIASGLDIRKEYECINSIYEIGGNLPEEIKERYSVLSTMLNVKDKLSLKADMDRLQLATESLSPGEAELVMEYVFRTGNVIRAEGFANNWSAVTARDILNEMHIIDSYKYVLWNIETYENTHDVSFEKRLTTGAYNDAAIPTLSDNTTSVIQIWNAYEQILKYASDNKYYAVDKVLDGYKIAYVELQDYVPEIVHLPELFDSYEEATAFFSSELSNENTSLVEDSSKLVELESATSVHLSSDYLIYETVRAEAANKESDKAKELLNLLKDSFEGKAQLEQLDNSIIDRLREAETVPERLCYIDYKDDAVSLFISDIAGNIYERKYDKENAMSALDKVDVSDYRLCGDYDEFMALTNNNRYHLKNASDISHDNEVYVEVINGQLESQKPYTVHDFAAAMSKLQTEGQTGIVKYRLSLKNNKGDRDTIICEADINNELSVFEQLHARLIESGEPENEYICNSIVKQYCNDMITRIDNDLVKPYLLSHKDNEADASELISNALDCKSDFNELIRSLDVSPADAELMKLEPGIINKRQDIKNASMEKPVQQKVVRQEQQIELS